MVLIGAAISAGPLSGALTNVYGCRKVALVGGFIGCSGLVLSTFATSLMHLYCTFGIMAGTSSCCYEQMRMNSWLFDYPLDFEREVVPLLNLSYIYSRTYIVFKSCFRLGLNHLCETRLDKFSRQPFPSTSTE